MAPTTELDRLIAGYGDLLFDLATALTDSPIATQNLFRAWLRDLARAYRARRRARAPALGSLERSWVLGVAYTRAQKMLPRFSPHLANAEQLQLDAADGVSQKMKRLGDFFKLLPRDEKWIVLLRDKHQIPFSEIASAMEIPEASLQLLRRSAYLSLEQKVWEEA